MIADRLTMVGRRLALSLSLIFFAATVCVAQGTAAVEDPAHTQLRALRDGLLEAYGKKDAERMLSFLADDVVITVQNGEVLRGHAGVLAFHKRMSEGANRRVESENMRLDVDELSILYGGDTAIAFGNMNDHLKLQGGMEFDLLSRWTATAVRQGDQWKLASMHVSGNIFDNGVSALQIKWAGVKAGAAGLFAGLLIAMLFCKRRKA